MSFSWIGHRAAMQEEQEYKYATQFGEYPPHIPPYYLQYPMDMMRYNMLYNTQDDHNLNIPMLPSPMPPLPTGRSQMLPGQLSPYHSKVPCHAGLSTNGQKEFPEVSVKLVNQRLWSDFHQQTTEMIITKAGRRLYPGIKLNISGLNRRFRYYLAVEMVLRSDRRLKYVGNYGRESGNMSGQKGWIPAGPAEPQIDAMRRFYMHPESPATGTHWMQHAVNFNKLKVTNNAIGHSSHIVLSSMHKYKPRIWVIRCSDQACGINDLYQNPSAYYEFDDTEFIAVTAYQNDNITKLKIDNNPFAKGFRTTGQSRSKRKDLLDVSSTDAADGHDEEEECNISSSDRGTPTSCYSPESTCLKRRRITSSTEDISASCGNVNMASNASTSSAFCRSGASSSCSASSSDAVSPSLQQAEEHQEDPGQPRFHRPWLDESTSIVKQDAVAEEQECHYPEVSDSDASDCSAMPLNLATVHNPQSSYPFQDQPNYVEFAR